MASRTRGRRPRYLIRDNGTPMDHGEKVEVVRGEGRWESLIPMSVEVVVAFYAALSVLEYFGFIEVVWAS